MLKRIASLLFIAITFVVSTGCASIINGTKQKISVTTPSFGARCSLQNDKGQWMINQTPGVATINRSSVNLKVSCNKPGYRAGLQHVSAGTSKAVFGNAIIGGLLGTGIDFYNGAAYTYPDNVYVPMEKKVA